MYVDVLRHKRSEVLGDIEGLRTQASELANRLAAKESQLRNLDDLLSLEAGGLDGLEGQDKSQPRGAPLKSQRFTDAAVALLTERGVPTHYQELATALNDRGVYVPGKDPGANLIAHMLRDDRFARGPGRGMYGLSEWPGMRKTGGGPVRAKRGGRVPAGRRGAVPNE
jgi:hypothetical protein